MGETLAAAQQEGMTLRVVKLEVQVLENNTGDTGKSVYYTWDRQTNMPIIHGLQRVARMKPKKASPASVCGHVGSIYFASGTVLLRAQPPR